MKKIMTGSMAIGWGVFLNLIASFSRLCMSLVCGKQRLIWRRDCELRVVLTFRVLWKSRNKQLKSIVSRSKCMGFLPLGDSPFMEGNGTLDRII